MNDIRKMKTAIITGAYGAIGKVISLRMAEAGFRTCLVGRNEVKLREVTEDIIRNTGNQEVFFELADLSSGKEIRSFADRWNGELSVLINNAATAPGKRTESMEGVEMQFAVNVLSYFRIIISFSDHMKSAVDPRIVNVASYWAGGLELHDIEFKKRNYNNDSAYRQSKQADRMLTVAFAERLKSSGISVNSCHPGDVNSKLSNDLGFGGHETADKGAATPFWLATSRKLENRTGLYFSDCRETFCEFSSDRDSIEKLFDICSEYL